ncbi:pentapeptide repeat-containing protein [Altericista sp. CCNU0014]|uniref:pentapeptide repeat-containing protein n=1 Tax=Altericista sp. CCNU0014 TaxID=3082949 RepID=UPI003850561F
MKSARIAALGVLAFVSWANPTYAQTSAPIEQLQNSRICKGCDFSNADLKGKDFSNVDLSGANLGNADLSGANLRNANLSGANLYLTKLSNADLSGANLSGANVKGATLAGANLTDSNLAGADFSYATLPSANLSGADLSKTNLGDADLSQANLEKAKLIGTNLSHTNLTAANLSGTDLTGANLQTATLKDANFTGSNLSQTALAQQPGTAQTAPGSGQNPEKADDVLENTKFKAEDSPIAKIPNQLPTAQHLKRGEVVFDFRQRYFFTNDVFSSSATRTGGSPTWSGGGIRWGITNSSELAVAYQNTDPVSIERQGAFSIFVEDSTPTWDFGVEFKQKIWENKSKTQALSGVISLAGFTEPGFIFNSPATGDIVRKGNGIVPGLAFPFTTQINDRLNLTISPTFAFFPADSALFLHRLPTANPGSFGTNFGLTGAISFQVHPRLVLWGEAFFPFVGNNSVSRNSGLPEKTLAINAGIRYLVNPRLGIDLYATNTFGSLGPLALTADNENFGFGANLVFMPGIIPANRENYPNNFKGQFNREDSPLTTDGLGFFDGGTVPAGKVLLQVQAGSGGIMAAGRYGLLRDLELGIYLDYVFGNVDESESGIAAKVRFLDQAKGALFTASGVVTFGLANEPIFNLTNNQADRFALQGVDKSVPIYFFDDSLNTGRGLIVATFSVPLQYQIGTGTAVWATPTIGFVQRGGISVAGITAGGSVQIVKDVSLLGEVGFNVAGDGNAFIGNRLADRIPWNFAVRWTPSQLLGFDFGDSLAKPSFELFVTNRVGASVFQQFRVREQNEPAVGVGVSIPF